MRTESRSLLLAAVAMGVVSVLAVIVFLESDSGSGVGQTPAHTELSADDTRWSRGLGEASESPDRNVAVVPGRLKTAHGTVPGRIAQSEAETQADDGSNEVEESRFVERSDSSPRMDGPEALSEEEKLSEEARLRRHEELVAERSRIREQDGRDEGPRGGRGKGPRRRSLKQFQAYWEAKSALEKEMGPEAYQQLLYENGESNVVTVGKVTPGSPAAAAGMLPGDEIFSYDGVRVYQPGTIRWLDSRAWPDQLIEIQFYRGGELYTTELARSGVNDARRGNTNGMGVIGESLGP